MPINSIIRNLSDHYLPPLHPRCVDTASPWEDSMKHYTSHRRRRQHNPSQPQTPCSELQLGPLRCFGAFGGKNFFIALTFSYREDITAAKDWDYEIDRCKSMWGHLFGSMNRFKGGSLDEYLTNYYAV